MTPYDWYNKKKKEYKAKEGEDWEYRSDHPTDPYSSVVYETMMRSAIEVNTLKPATHDEYVAIANAMMIRDYLKNRYLDV